MPCYTAVIGFSLRVRIAYSTVYERPGSSRTMPEPNEIHGLRTTPLLGDVYEQRIDSLMYEAKGH